MTNPSDSIKAPPPGIVVCVGGVVIKERQLLLIRQATGHSLEGQWTIPWGWVDPGESPEDAVLREIKEEAGIAVEIQGLLGIQNLPDPWEGWIGIIFQCKHISGNPEPDGGIETDRAGYFLLDELATFEDEIETWCAWLAKRVLSNEHQLIPPGPINPYSPKIGFL